jgi:hypothetical protein
MKIKSLLLLSITSVIVFTAKAQVFSTSDSNTVFRNQDGKVLNREELQE